MELLYCYSGHVRRTEQCQDHKDYKHNVYSSLEILHKGVASTPHQHLYRIILERSSMFLSPSVENRWICNGCQLVLRSEELDNTVLTVNIYNNGSVLIPFSSLYCLEPPAEETGLYKNVTGTVQHLHSFGVSEVKSDLNKVYYTAQHEQLLICNYRSVSASLNPTHKVR